VVSQRPLWKTLVLGVSLTSIGGGSQEFDGFEGAWVGGIEMGKEFVPFALRIGSGGGGISGSFRLRTSNDGLDGGGDARASRRELDQRSVPAARGVRCGRAREPCRAAHRLPDRGRRAGFVAAGDRGRAEDPPRRGRAAAGRPVRVMAPARGTGREAPESRPRAERRRPPPHAGAAHSSQHDR